MIFHICLLFLFIYSVTSPFVLVLCTLLLHVEDVFFTHPFHWFCIINDGFCVLALRYMVGIVTPLSGAWDCCSISLKSESGRLMGVPINCSDISFPSSLAWLS